MPYTGFVLLVKRHLVISDSQLRTTRILQMRCWSQSIHIEESRRNVTVAHLLKAKILEDARRHCI